jgi:hypothetical protein
MGARLTNDRRKETVDTRRTIDRLWNFAAGIGKVVDSLPETRLGRHVAGQLVRCGTSAPPNYDEACAGESRADFVHKVVLQFAMAIFNLQWPWSFPTV